MTARLPDGFTVRLNRHTRVVDDGAVLVGGSPTRISRLKPLARDRIHDGELIVTDAATRALADHLLATGMADPVVHALPPGDLALATVVVPVRDRPRQLDRLLAGIGGAVPVIVVDDASIDPGAVATVAARRGAKLLALGRNLGPAGARNAGLALVSTPYVVFVDSDVVVEPAAIELMLRHFADPALAMVAPRVLGLGDGVGDAISDANWITRYEDARSSLDLGSDSSSVRPRSPVTWVSSTCLVARVDALGAGFDESMRVGEDVDLVWRLVEEGRRVRFEPAASVRHEHRSTLRAWLGRKFFYGTGAHPLAERHPDDIAPVVLPPWGAAVLVALAAQRRWSIPVAALVLAATAVRIGGRATAVRHPYPLAARLTGYGLVGAVAQGFALLLRHWWPLTAIGCLVSRRVRRAVLVASVADTVWEFARTRPRLDPVRFGIARRLDDAAYGAGVWWSAIRGRSPKALLPDLRRRH
ncbi:mycofactocin biosynthesis glycosyltransferase MftF [Agromyces sp. Soil535]|uniref:mycofactocin biosynthesis glycosyltransferase MftF n=1 Tax=Agromyces sp. Soil535 TaxID=1736390 RepID=UPI0007023027|nr:mycofactocin biosynthesis glycosyltransferase MftF [Agromyces sp. Soil535]KRE22955.1 mycofactocin system glycosyltransferase [Agromyces sp. Soil535]